MAKNIKKSFIFTNLENDILEQRIKGSKKDPTGIYASRIKPKILEILYWLTRISDLKKIVNNEKK